MYYLLDGITLKGKNRLRDHGKIWKHIKQRSPFQSEKILLSSVKDEHLMWVHPEKDEHHEVIDIIDDPDEFLTRKKIF